MKTLSIFVVTVAAILASSFGNAQTRVIIPDPPEVTALKQRYSQLLDQARGCERASRLEEALVLYGKAIEAASSLRNHDLGAYYGKARCYERLGRIDDALGAYRQAFLWNESVGDITPSRMPAMMQYSLLLAKQGRNEDAKAIYYLALRSLSGRSRRVEQTPFLVVFDPEPGAIVWEFSEARLEAAATMLMAMMGGPEDMSQEDLRKKAAQLAPDWYYPILWNGNDNRIARAEVLARQGLEQELLACFKAERSEYIAANPEDRSLYGFYSQQYTEGAERRARMQCLKPNPVILKRLCRPSQ